jgi:DNA-binding XRE family transcriptional regulator
MRKYASPAQIRKRVAFNVRRFRERSGDTQHGLASRSAIDRKTINRIENGHFSPSLDTLARIAKSQKTPITDYFKGAK